MERRVDELERIVIPKHIRRKLGLETRTKVAFETEGDRLIITKAFPTCIICGSEDKLVEVKDKHICTDCISIIK
ncbi:MAG: AbrB/MazE/SpoVT family DNA-binding domain-containing protein [Clostridia bacterium]|nr:AbrB/MazE/SpoVT family DNA-binding domain-containing protein [Clostridia bacterium]